MILVFLSAVSVQAAAQHMAAASAAALKNRLECSEFRAALKSGFG